MLQTTFETVDSHPAYRKVLEYLLCGRNGRRKIKRATYLRMDTEGIGLWYYSTRIVLFKPRSFVIDLDGWRSITTKDRLYRGVYQAAEFSINLWRDRGRYIINCNGHRYFFEDGMEFDYEGNALNASAEPYRKWMERREQLSEAYWRNVMKSVMDIRDVEHELGADITSSLENWRWNQPPYAIVRYAYPGNGYLATPLIQLPVNIDHLAVREAFITADFKVFKVAGLMLHGGGRPVIMGIYLMGRDQTGQLWCHSLPPFGYALASIKTCERWLFDMRPGDELVAEA